MAENVVSDGRASAHGRGEFGALLRSFRDRAQRSGNSLAREVELDPSYLSRLENGEREPPRADIVKKLAHALGLSLFDENRLLLTAGHAPLSLEQLGRWDTAVQAVLDVLTDHDLTAEEREDFSVVVRSLAAHWGKPRAARREA